jgi:NAD(P)-dependent dehydrogenase (short-subunit alcohol dehydrogenase family)
MAPFDLSGKVVLVTGIGAVGDGWGNGTTMATVFARQGATIFGCDLNPAAAQKAAETIKNDDEARSHPAHQSGGSINVDVMQGPVVSIYPHWFQSHNLTVLLTVRRT